MGFRSRLIGFLALMAALAALLFLFLSGDAPMVQRLPDGSYLRVAAVAYGPKHQYSLAALPPWQEFLARYLPAAWVNRLGWRGGKATVGSGARPGEQILGVVTICEKVTQASFGTPRLELRDAEGRSYGWALPRATSGVISGGHNRGLIMWTASECPPADKALVLRFTFAGPDRDGQTKPGEVQFTVPNPLAKAKDAK